MIMLQFANQLNGQKNPVITWLENCLCESGVNIRKSKGDRVLLDFNKEVLTEEKLKNTYYNDLLVIKNEDLNIKSNLKILKQSEATFCFKGDVNGLEEVLDKEVTKIEFIPILPSNQIEIKNVFGEIYTQDETLVRSIITQMKMTEAKYDKLHNVSKLFDANVKNTHANILLKKISSSTQKNLIVIIGHNEDGLLKLTDNSSVKISEIINISNKNKSPVLILSCETISYEAANATSNSVLTTKKLEYTEIADALIYLDKEVQIGGEPLKFIKIINTVEIGLNSIKSQKDLKQKVAIASTAGAVISTFVIGINAGEEKPPEEEESKKSNKESQQNKN